MELVHVVGVALLFVAASAVLVVLAATVAEMVVRRPTSRSAAKHTVIGRPAGKSADSTVPVPSSPDDPELVSRLPTGTGWAKPGDPQYALQLAMFEAVHPVPGKDPSATRVVYGRDGVGRIEPGPVDFLTVDTTNSKLEQELPADSQLQGPMLHHGRCAATVLSAAELTARVERCRGRLRELTEAARLREDDIRAQTGKIYRDNLSAEQLLALIRQHGGAVSTYLDTAAREAGDRSVQLYREQCQQQIEKALNDVILYDVDQDR